MRAIDVLTLLRELRSAGIDIRIDGGWCVDALVGRSLRDHADLDLAVDRRHLDALRGWLRSRGFRHVPRDGTTDWCFVVEDDRQRRLDVHAYAYDDRGDNVWGIAYPHGSLTGTGWLDGEPVPCVAPEWMFRFKTAYEPAEKDLVDVEALAARFGFEVPPTHRRTHQEVSDRRTRTPR